MKGKIHLAGLNVRYILAIPGCPHTVYPSACSLPLFFIRTGYRINLSPALIISCATQQISTYQVCSCTEASRCLPAEPVSIAHDSVKRLLEWQPHHTGALYEEAQRLIRANEGVLVIDDSTLDKPYSHQIELVTRHWSGKHHRVVQGINLISTIWTDGSAIVPVDFRIYCPD